MFIPLDQHIKMMEILLGRDTKRTASGIAGSVTGGAVGVYGVGQPQVQQ